MNPRSVFAIAAFTFARERSAMRSVDKRNALETDMHSHQITDVEQVKRFVRAGNARFTLVSQKTGARFTFQVRKPEDADVFFVRVLTGPSNEDAYTFLGTIKADGSYAHGMRSTIGQDAPSARAFRYFFDHVADGNLQNLEFWHEGRCGRCGRVLTVPGSIETGFGPDCAEAMGFQVRQGERDPDAPSLGGSPRGEERDLGAAEWMPGEYNLLQEPAGGEASP